jgi:hypothetical protein
MENNMKDFQDRALQEFTGEEALRKYKAEEALKKSKVICTEPTEAEADATQPLTEPGTAKSPIQKAKTKSSPSPKRVQFPYIYFQLVDFADSSNGGGSWFRVPNTVLTKQFFDEVPPMHLLKQSSEYRTRRTAIKKMFSRMEKTWISTNDIPRSEPLLVYIL